jgi:CD63 antigen
MMTINVVYLVLGMAVTALGVMGFFVVLQLPYALVYSISFIVFGIVLIFVAIIGICGAVRAMWPLLIVYSLLIFGIFILYLGTIVYIFAVRDSEIVTFKVQFQSWMEDYPDYQTTVDMFQRNFHCCGWNGPSSWAAYNRSIPASCCMNNYGYLTCDNNWEQGCEQAVGGNVSKFMNIIGGIDAFIAAFQVIVFILSLCLIGVTIAIEKRRRMENSPLLQPTTCTPNNTMIQQ